MAAVQFSPHRLCDHLSARLAQARRSFLEPREQFVVELDLWAGLPGGRDAYDEVAVRLLPAGELAQQVRLGGEAWSVAETLPPDVGLGLDDPAPLPEAAECEIRPWWLPNLRAVGSTIVGLLGHGVAANLALDAQAKGLGEHLRARVVEVPPALLVAPR